MLKFPPILRDREKLDFLKLRFYNLQNDYFFGLKSDTRMATELVAKYCSLLLSFKNKWLIQILQVGLPVVLYQVRDSTSNLSWYISYYEHREVEISYVYGYMYVIIIIMISIFLEDNEFSMNASLPFGPPINTDIDYYQAYFIYLFIFILFWLVLRC